MLKWHYQKTILQLIKRKNGLQMSNHEKLSHFLRTQYNALLSTQKA